MRKNYDHIIAFLAVAKDKSFTKAAAKLGVSQSTLSHTIRGFEERLGVRLLTRTTRSVALTEAGKRLFTSVNPHFEEIENELDALSEFRDKPAGTIRITSTEYAVETILWPKLKTFLPKYPDIKIEINIDYSMTDIVAQQYDAGVRAGEQIANDMIAVKIGPDMRMIVVGSPSYFTQHTPPKTPKELIKHKCINLRLPTFGGLYAWEFQKKGQKLNVHVTGQLTFNRTTQLLNAALDGFGLTYVPEDLALPHIKTGELQIALDDWCPTSPGYHIYYPNRRHASPAFSLLVDVLRYKP